MSILKNGYYKVTIAKRQQLHVVTKGANHETVNSSENLPTWETVKTNILSAIRASNGKDAVVVDATLQNMEKRRLYYLIKEDGKLQLITVDDSDDKQLDDAESQNEGGF
jgi:hypothetical protein